MNKKIMNEQLVELGIYSANNVVSKIDNVDLDFVYRKSSDSKNYLIETNNLSPEEVQTALLIKQTELIKTIKSMVLFFVILSGVGIFAYLISFLQSQ